MFVEPSEIYRVTSARRGDFDEFIQRKRAPIKKMFDVYDLRGISIVTRSNALVLYTWISFSLLKERKTLVFRGLREEVFDTSESRTSIRRRIHY